MVKFEGYNTLRNGCGSGTDQVESFRKKPGGYYPLISFAWLTVKV